VHTIERTLSILHDARYRIGPLDAHRARHVIRHSEAVLLEALPEIEHEPTYSPATIMAFDVSLYVSRLVIGFWLLPLVLTTHGLLRPKAEAPASS
jgi:hypothetical protein